MAVLVDASTPARASVATTAGGATVVTASFTPPNNSFLVACLEADTSAAEAFTMTASGGGLTWTKQAERNGTDTTAGGYAGIFTAPVTTGASMTVTLTRTQAAANSGRMSLKVYVLTGADNGGTPVDTITASNTGTGATQTDQALTTLTPGATGLLMVAATEWNALGACSSSDLTADHAEYASILDVIDGYKVCTSGVNVTGHLTSAAGTPQWKWAQIIVRAPASTPTDTYSAPIEGTASLGRAAKAFTKAAIVAAALLWNPAQDQSAPLGPQPDTYQPPIAGQTAFRSGQLAQAQRTRIAIPLGWTLPEDPPVTAAIIDTYVQPIQGTGALAQSAKAFSARAGLAPLGWIVPQDVSGPLAPQGDTYQAPIAGTAALGQAAKAFARAAQGAALGWTLPEDVNAPTIQPDTALQPIAGLSALSTASRASAATARTASALLWTLPQDLSGPLPVQPDTYQSPVLGVAAIGQNQRAGWQRVSQSSALIWAPATDVPLPIQPDTWTQPIVGLSALNQAARTWSLTAGKASILVWNPAVDRSGPLATQPDLSIQPVQGVASLARAAVTFQRSAVSATLLAWSLPVDMPSTFQAKWAAECNKYIPPPVLT